MGTGPPRVAVVTGAASGIGEATARRLLADGWTVHGWDLRRASDDAVIWTQVDVADPDAVGAAARDVPSLSLLVNSAGITERAPAAEMRPDQWRRVLDVDLSGTFWCCQALHGALASARGVIVSVASIAGHRAFAGRVNYCVAKAGVVMLTQVLGQEWAADGIRVLAVSPGYVGTDMVLAGIAGGWVSEEAVIGRTPMRRLAQPDEIAGAIVSLAGADFSYATGSTVLVDGGWTANGGF